MSTTSASEAGLRPDVGGPRLGFLGMGWIGRSRMASLMRERPVTVVAVADPDPAAAREAALEASEAGGATVALSGLDELLELELDGLVIATPSALHAEQATAALERGVAVFSQKPLARDAAEATAVLTAAECAGRPFGVDLSYRHTSAARLMRSELLEGRIGEVFAAELVFHNAYGPDREWFLDRRLAGGGCVIDLGTHLVDLLLWLLGGGLSVRAATLMRRGGQLVGAATEVEDFAAVQLSAAGGAPVQLACSWFLPAGRDCVFGCTLYGTEGSLRMANVGGSFYDFTLERCRGTQTETLVAGPDEWGARALCAWVDELERGQRFDPQLASELLMVSRVLDEIYAAAADAAGTDAAGAERA